MKIKNPLKGQTEYGWHFEQNVYEIDSLVRSLKAGEGSGNIPKILEVYEDKVQTAKAEDNGNMGGISI